MNAQPCHILCAVGKDFPFHTSFTTCFSDSTKLICILKSQKGLKKSFSISSSLLSLWSENISTHVCRCPWKPTARHTSNRALVIHLMPFSSAPPGKPKEVTVLLNVKSFASKFGFANLLCDCVGLGDCSHKGLARYWIASVLVRDRTAPIYLHPHPSV